ncbi:DUF1624 domain-containing protein [Microbulbifer halophilus]|uniref:DUF1624 domain-containing protein n=1 Tax=Microbulbifer halophilus TaxID=453963 RepID=A0ABW5EF02_9GAMM|nr:heparan-alpha-glucosaminide N-acetyltransferase domain-containing protein [Microbulbifer halophilus]MCW8128043.1 heparan-alpha-glucosaminide N-acetyltransferase domain-containing protein [Microbulbifer halophilus]
MAVVSTPPLTAAAVANKSRIASIDIMRGLVIVLMLVDHVRERFYLHRQVSDPMDVDSTSPALFFTRLAAHLCAPTFVFLTGLSAWLYAHPSRGGARSPSGFLFKRGLFLVLLEVTLVNFSWAGSFGTFWLQVIWVIGLSMIALSLLVTLRYWMIGAIGFLIVFGHNLLTPITFEPGEFGYGLWTLLHDRGYLLDTETLRIKISYPLLPWIGVIALGYFAGPLYARTTDAAVRRRALVGLGLGCLALLLVLRGFNIYGETLPWVAGGTALQTAMSFVNFTKYPPSLDFLLLTLGVAFPLLAWFENGKSRLMDAMEVLGSAPMFFYILHLYVLLILYQTILATVGPNHGELFGVEHIWWIWMISAILTVVLYFPTRAFARFKHSTKMGWVKYF